MSGTATPLYFILFWLTIICFGTAFKISNLLLTEDAEAIGDDYNPDADLTTPNLIRKYDYPSESHVVKTEDGYLLTLHRIPGGHNSSIKKAAVNKPVVLLQHGLLSSSADWILTGPKKSLAYILADAGYDVWLGNIRGNTYSSSHVSLSTKDSKFWDFSFDEMGYYDMPAMIDFILHKTGEKQLSYVGHSMGTSIFYAMASSKPQYNDKIRVMVALAPVAFLSHVKSPIRYLTRFSRTLYFINHFLGAGEFLPRSIVLKYLSKYACEMFVFQKKLCQNIFFILSGFDKAQFNMTLLPVFLGHTPAGASTRTILHFGQLIRSGMFQPYNCNMGADKFCYKPPPVSNYNLSLITTPVTLHYGENDWLADMEDVSELRSSLRNIVGNYEIAFPLFNHIDFLWGIDAPKLVYKAVLDVLRKYRSSEPVEKHMYKFLKLQDSADSLNVSYL